MDSIWLHIEVAYCRLPARVIDPVESSLIWGRTVKLLRCNRHCVLTAMARTIALIFVNVRALVVSFKWFGGG